MLTFCFHFDISPWSPSALLLWNISCEFHVHMTYLSGMLCFITQPQQVLSEWLDEWEQVELNLQTCAAHYAEKHIFTWNYLGSETKMIAALGLTHGDENLCRNRGESHRLETFLRYNVALKNTNRHIGNQWLSYRLISLHLTKSVSKCSSALMVHDQWLALSTLNPQ